MTKAEDMTEGARNGLDVVLAMSGIEENDRRVLVITDMEKEEIGKAFSLAAKELGAVESNLYRLPRKKRPLGEIPGDLKALVQANFSVIVNAFSGMAEETPFRIKLIKSEIASGARVGHAPGITEEMMSTGPMTADYKKMAENVDYLMDRFTGAAKVRVTAPGGTDITLNILDRAFDTDVRIGPGTFGNLPAGEIWCAPVEDGAEGRIVCDGSIGDLGQVPSPVTIEVKEGRIVSIQGQDHQFIKRIDELVHVDEEADVVGELGIGLNPAAEITGNLLEDEKAGRTGHIAFGNNEEMPGGQNKSKTHRDFLFHRPTMKVTFKDGREETLIEDGNVL